MKDIATAEDDVRALTASIDEPAAFRAIFELHHGSVARYLSARVGDRTAAEDLAAETFARAFAARASFRDEGHGVRAWLFRIATNLLHDEFRARARRGGLLDRLRAVREPDGAGPALPADPALAAALRRLRREELEPILLHAWGELSYAEIAAALELPVGTVRSRIHRGRERLQGALGGAPSATSDERTAS